MASALFRLFIIMLGVALIAAACGSSGPDGTDGARDPGSSEQSQSSSDQTAQDEAELVADYPQELVLPGSQLTESSASLEAGGLRTIAVWRISADVDDILSFYEGAFNRVAVPGNPQRVELGDFGSLTFGDADAGPASVTVDTTADGNRLVTVAYLVTAGAATPSSGDGDPADSPTPITTADAEDLLLEDDDLPQRVWSVVDSQGFVVEFGNATAVLFSNTSCGGLDDLILNLEAFGPDVADSATRSFRSGAGFDFGRLITGIAIYDSVADATTVFDNARDALNSGALLACFAGGITEAEAAAAAVGASVSSAFGDPDFLLQGAAGQQAHIEAGAAGIGVNVDMQIHTFQRANVVALFATVISNDAALVAAIPQILCTFEQRALGSSGPGGQDCLESPATSAPAAGSDNGTPAPPPPSDDDDGGTPSTPPPSDDGNGDGGARVGDHPIPPALLFRTGPGAWTAQENAEGVRFFALFNVDDDVAAILNFYQGAFASLGAPNITVREETPFTGLLTSTGSAGRGRVEVIGATSSTKSVNVEFLQFN